MSPLSLPAARPFMNSLVTSMIFTVTLVGSIGCSAVKPKLKPEESNRRVVPVMRTEASHQALEKFAALKNQKRPKTKIIFSRSKVATGGLPAGAPELDPLLEHAFSALAPSGLYFVPPETLPTLIQAAGNGRLPAKYMQEDGEAPEILMLRVSAYLDRAIQNTREGLTLQALLMLKNGYVQPEYDMELEKEVSRLSVKILVENPDGNIDPVCASLSADLVQQKESSKVALLIFGSGGAYYDHVLVVDGLGTSLDTVISYAVLACCGRALGLPYWDCGFGEPDPDALTLGAERMAEAAERRAQARAVAEAMAAAAESEAAASSPIDAVPNPSTTAPTDAAINEAQPTTSAVARHSTPRVPEAPAEEFHEPAATPRPSNRTDELADSSPSEDSPSSLAERRTNELESSAEPSVADPHVDTTSSFTSESRASVSVATPAKPEARSIGDTRKLQPLVKLTAEKAALKITPVQIDVTQRSRH